MISPSEYTKNLIDTKYTHGKKEIRVISNGVDIEKFSKKEDLKEIFLKEYNIDSPVVVTAGLPFERKGIIEFVKVVEKFPEYRFFWFGASSIKPLLPKRIQKIIEMPPKNLMFPGFVDEEILLGAFSAADLFLFMTYEENEGIVVLESLSTKLPILLRDIPVYNGWLEDGKNCLKAKTTADFIEKLEMIVNNIEETLFENYANHNYSIVVDNTNLKHRYIKPWISLAGYYGYNVRFKIFDVPAEICKERVMHRDFLGKTTPQLVDYIDIQDKQFQSIVEWINNNYKDKILK